MSNDGIGKGSPEFRAPGDHTGEMPVARQSQASDSKPSNKPTPNPHVFKREPNGEVRVRIRLRPSEAALIEAAAGKTPLMLYLHRIINHMARIHVQQREEATKGLAAAKQMLADTLNEAETANAATREAVQAKVTHAQERVVIAQAVLDRLDVYTETEDWTG